MSDQALHERFKFDEADLNANRNGRLSDKQKQRLVKENKSSKISGAVAGLVFLGIGSIFSFVFIPQYTLPGLQKHDLSMILHGLVPAVIWAFVWGGIGVLIIIGLFKTKS